MFNNIRLFFPIKDRKNRPHKCPHHDGKKYKERNSPNYSQDISIMNLRSIIFLMMFKIIFWSTKRPINFWLELLTFKISKISRCLNEVKSMIFIEPISCFVHRTHLLTMTLIDLIVHMIFLWVDMASIIMRNRSAFLQKDQKCHLNKWMLFPL